MVSDRIATATLEKVMSGRGTVTFRDFEALLTALGFTMRNQRGSHRIYIHPAIDRPFPIQPDGKDAKRYQIRELRDMIRRYGIELGPGG
ncbi:MAG: type II toxin-antitoxin system HicA family toxin [Xanthobacteraceae bacterium]